MGGFRRMDCKMSLTQDGILQADDLQAEVPPTEQKVQDQEPEGETPGGPDGETPGVSPPAPDSDGGLPDLHLIIADPAVSYDNKLIIIREAAATQPLFRNVISKKDI